MCVRVCVRARMHVRCIVGDLSLHTLTHRRTMYTAPLYPAASCRPGTMFRSPLRHALRRPSRAFPHPSLSTTLTRFTSLHVSLCVSPRLAAPRRATPRLTLLRFAFSSFSLPATISLPRGALARATSDALCCRRVVAVTASIPRLSRFRLGCRRGSRGDLRPPGICSFEMNQMTRN